MSVQPTTRRGPAEHNFPPAVADPLSGFFNDLHVYDPANMTWTDLSAAVSGTPPSPRYGHGFAGAGGVLYSFGGLGVNNGGCRAKKDDAGRLIAVPFNDTQLSHPRS